MHLTSKQIKVLKQLSRFEEPINATTVYHPRLLITLAEHGLVKMTVEITDKGLDHTLA